MSDNNHNIFIFAGLFGIIGCIISLWVGIAMSYHQKPFNKKDESITGVCLIISAMFIGMGCVLFGIIVGCCLKNTYSCIENIKSNNTEKV
jgi:tellurite resistance protein TehA-like permease